ncbi:pseudaminic acid biosynthesis-associated methylase [Metapseudomonas otitidis]|uniref:pseudaminic acid biosynthesis-associated methylase n=1 Tax=Metapseudomonas otitidis TaxID=319939 RepID=UPI0013F60991|nr:pseudaminic acid biosynthesis-associated methylase [Pseudomonas otitidis]
MRELTEQERFWQGEFGDDYVDRNDGERHVASATAFFAQALRRAGRLDSLLELGTNRGLNLQALHRLLPDAALRGVELNAKAHVIAQSLGIAEVWHGSLFDYPVHQPVDLAFTRGVLIHLPPELLPKAYAKLYEASRRYVLVAEYYNPSPVEVSYRGYTGKLFKRDFAGELLDRYEDLRLVDYGFVYHRDPSFPTDDITWFLLEKRP